MEDDSVVTELRARLEARAELPEHRERAAYRDAAMDTLKKGAPGLSHTSALVLANSIAMKCQAARERLGFRTVIDLIASPTPKGSPNDR